MPIKQIPTFYIQALQQKNEPAFSKIIEDVAAGKPKKMPQYQYGSLDYKSFKSVYTSQGWLGRKIIALPKSLWNGIILPIYHFVKAIFIGLAKLSTDGGVYMKLQFYYMRRDFQESFGRFISLFTDKLGLFQIQESQFNKLCYELYQKNPNYTTHEIAAIQKQYPIGNSIYSAESKKTELKLSRLSPIEFQKIIPFLKDEHFSLIPASHLKYLDTSTLVKHFSSIFEGGTVYGCNKFEHLTSDQFAAIVPRLHDNQFQHIPCKYVNLLNFNTLTTDLAQTAIKYSGLALLPSQISSRIGLLDQKNFKGLVSKLNTKQMPLIPLSHLKYVDSSILSSHFEEIFPVGPEEHTKKKFEALSGEQFKSIVYKLTSKNDYYSKIYLSSVPDKFIDLLNYNVLSGSQFLVVLNVLYNPSGVESKLSELSSPNFELIKNKLPLSVYGSIPAKHIASLNYANLTAAQVAALFPTEGSNKTNSKIKFATLASWQIQLIFSKLSDRQLTFITSQQFKDQALTKMYVDRVSPPKPSYTHGGFGAGFTSSYAPPLLSLPILHQNPQNIPLLVVVLDRPPLGISLEALISLVAFPQDLEQVSDPLTELLTSPPTLARDTALLPILLVVLDQVSPLHTQLPHRIPARDTALLPQLLHPTLAQVTGDHMERHHSRRKCLFLIKILSLGIMPL